MGAHQRTHRSTANRDPALTPGKLTLRHASRETCLNTRYRQPPKRGAGAGSDSRRGCPFGSTLACHSLGANSLLAAYLQPGCRSFLKRWQQVEGPFQTEVGSVSVWYVLGAFRSAFCSTNEEVASSTCERGPTLVGRAMNVKSLSSRVRSAFAGPILLALLRAEFLRPAHGGCSASRFPRHIRSSFRPPLRVPVPPENISPFRKRLAQEIFAGPPGNARLVLGSSSLSLV